SASEVAKWGRRRWTASTVSSTRTSVRSRLRWRSTSDADGVHLGDVNEWSAGDNDMKMRNFLSGASLLLFGAVGRADLNVTNQNNPDIDRVIKTPADLEGLIASSFNTWFDMLYHYNGLEPIMSVASFQHSAMAANFGMEVYGRIPRIAFVNQQEDAYA